MTFFTRSAGALAKISILAFSVNMFSGCGGSETSPSGGSIGGSGTAAATPGGTRPGGSNSPADPAPQSNIEGDRVANFNPEPVSLSPQSETSPFRFTEIHKEAGIDFVSNSGMTEERYFPSANGSGVAIFDYDGDGKLDIYFSTATPFPIGKEKTGPNRLYKNLGDNKFQDVTEKAGVGYAGFCHGAMAGDIDNDGDQDLILCNYGPNVLYLNNGNGTFKDISKSSGIGRPSLVGVIEGVGKSGGGDDSVVIDSVSGPSWKSGDQTGTKIKLKAKKGAKLVFRQADGESPRGVKFRNPQQVIKAGEPDNPDAVLREVGSEKSRVDVRVPALAKGKDTAVFAEFEVIKDIGEPVIFQCAVFDRAWSSGGAFLDYDNDGDLDLYISNYGNWDFPEDDHFCGDRSHNIRLYCSPRTIRTCKHFFYRNNGDGTFTEVYDEVITTEDPDTKKRRPNPRDDGHGFGVVTADVNGDGKIDIYVANDMNPNFLFLNLGNGTFDDATEASGAAFDEKGQAQSGMGVDCEDVDGDGLPDLFVTNFANEYNTLYQNVGNGFQDATPFFGLTADTMPWVGWGTALADLDNDGWPDNFVTNGHVDNNRHKLVPPQNVEYEEWPLLFWNMMPQGKRRFRLATRDAGPYFDTKHVGRGAAFGDLDNDGDIDIVVNHKDGPPAILRNDTKNDNRWIRLELQGKRSNRDGVGAKIEVKIGDLVIQRQRKGGYSMESSNDPRVLIGVGPVQEVNTLTVRWPSGAVSTLEHLKTNQTHKIVEPEGAK